MIALFALAVADPVTVSHAVALDDAVDVTVELLDAADAVVWTGTYAVAPRDGVATLQLVFDDALLDGDNELVTRFGDVVGRTPLATVPRAAWAHRVSGGDVHAASVTVDGGLGLGAVATCDTAGVVAWDEAAHAVRVCDGATWTVYRVGGG